MSALPPIRGVDPEGWCAHCVSDDDRAALRAREPRALHQYLSDAISMWGTEEDFLAMLPELLDEVARGHTVLTEIVDKCRLADWVAWPDELLDALRGYLAALWGYTLAERPRASRWMHELADALAEVHEEVAPFLDAWAASARPAEQEAFTRFVRDYAQTLFAHGCGPDEPGQRRVLAWMLRPGTVTALEAAFFATDDSDQAALLSDAAETVRRLVEATDGVDEADPDKGP